MKLLLILTGLLPEKAHALNYHTTFCNLTHSWGCSATPAAAAAGFGNALLNFVTGFIAAGCLIAVLYGGLRIATSGGSDQGKEAGKTIITAALIGLVLALASNAIIDWVAGLVMGL